MTIFPNVNDHRAQSPAIDQCVIAMVEALEAGYSVAFQCKTAATTVILIN